MTSAELTQIILLSITTVGAIVAALFGLITTIYSAKIKKDVNSNWSKSQEQIAEQGRKIVDMGAAITGMLRDNTPTQQAVADQAGLNSLGGHPHPTAVVVAAVVDPSALKQSAPPVAPPSV